jgi:hypothetical protein
MPAGYTPTKIMIVSSYEGQSNRVFDLSTPHTNGEWPLYDLYVEHGRIVFQLYAACRGCDFTEHRNGITGIGYATFLQLLNDMDGEPTPAKLAKSIWNEYEKLARGAGLLTEKEVLDYLQRIVDIYSLGNVYDNDRNIIDFGGSIVQSANSHLKQHANGKLNSRTAEPFTPDFKTVMENLDCSQLLNETVADVSTIRGVKLR